MTTSSGKNMEKYLPWAATVAVIALFLGFLWGNHDRSGTLTIGKKGVEIQVSNNERIEKIIDKILDQQNDSYEREALVMHLLSVIQNNPDVGTRVLAIAKKSQKPFRWNYEDAEIRFDPKVPSEVFLVCKDNSNLLESVISVQVLDQQRNEFVKEGNQLYALPGKECGSAKNIIFSSDRALVTAASQPGHLAKVRPVVIIPR